MIEREQHRLDAHALHAKLIAFLRDHEEELAERVARTAIERGYTRYVPELKETLRTLVSGTTRAIGGFVDWDHKSAFCPGEDLEGDPLASFVRAEAHTLLTRGVRAEVVFGLLQQCRLVYMQQCTDAVIEHREVWQALIEVCFDRMELGLVASWASPGFVESGQWLVSRDASSPRRPDTADRSIPEGVDPRVRELSAINDALRRELEQRQRVEEERELYYRALLHSQKLEAVGSLAGGVAHDLNNLLQVMRCNIDAMRERADRASFGLLEEMRQVTERAVSLVRQLLLFSRKQPMARRVLDVGDVARDLMRMLHRVLPENVRIISEIAERLPPVRADVSAVEQLLLNLVINARDAMPNGGTIHVTIGHEQRVPPERVRTKGSMDQVAIWVRDAGPGMEDEVMARIFDPFFTTKVHSSGLGLSVVYGVVEEHGGWVEVSSVVGQGSCFAVYLPVVDEGALGEPPSTREQVTNLVGRGERILLVEDEESVRRALARELTRHGFAVQAVATGEDALKIFRRSPGYFDCVVSDGIMPGISGPEMVIEMLKSNPQQRAIFMSGYAPTLDCWKDLQNRGYRLLAKPFGIGELVAALRETLDYHEDLQAVTVRASHLAR